MCGIVGFAGRDPLLNADQLGRMRDTLIHRGPNDAGLELWGANGRACLPGELGVIGLAHRRLSIIDLSPAGHQPMSNEDGTVWIVFNGEFYNFAEYRAELEGQGHVFKSRTDTETIIHLYEQHGIEETLRRMNGMFAFAIWDARRRRLVLARDRVGKKPLYYVMRPDGALLFASEMKALLASGLVDRDAVDWVALDQVWEVGVTVGEHTIYQAVRRLLPAHYATWSDGSLAPCEYWDCRPDPAAAAGRFPESKVDELEALLCDSIRLRLIADVPVGLFLSGGIDSSLIAALTQKVSGGRIASYTIGFSQPGFDESCHAQAVARAIGIENHVLRIDEEMAGAAESVARQFDEPFGDSSAIPTYFVSKLARRHVTVALTGDGGDECFAGYESFRQALRIWGDPAQRRAFARPLRLMERLWEAKLRWLGFPKAFVLLDGKLARRKRNRLFKAEFRARVSRADMFQERMDWLARVPCADLLSRLQYVTQKTWLADDFLRKVDMMSMAHALECRCPLLDHRVAEFAARLPYEAKMDGDGNGKRILRALLARYVPAALFERPKQGFGIPWEYWCRGAMGQQLRQRWRAWKNPWFEPGAADILFPAEVIGSNFLQWNGYVTLAHFNRLGDGDA